MPEQRFSIIFEEQAAQRLGDGDQFVAHLKQAAERCKVELVGEPFVSTSDGFLARVQVNISRAFDLGERADVCVNYALTLHMEASDLHNTEDGEFYIEDAAKNKVIMKFAPSNTPS